MARTKPSAISHRLKEAASSPLKISIPAPQQQDVLSTVNPSRSASSASAVNLSAHSSAVIANSVLPFASFGSVALLVRFAVNAIGAAAPVAPNDGIAPALQCVRVDPVRVVPPAVVTLSDCATGRTALIAEC